MKIFRHVLQCSSMFFNVLHVVSCGLHLPGEHPVSQRSSAQRAKAQPSVDQTNYVSIHTAIASRYVSMNHITSFQEIHLSVPNTTSKTSNEVLPVSSTGSGHRKAWSADIYGKSMENLQVLSEFMRFFNGDLWWLCTSPLTHNDFRRATASRSWLT